MYQKQQHHAHSALPPLQLLVEGLLAVKHLVDILPGPVKVAMHPCPAINTPGSALQQSEIENSVNQIGSFIGLLPLKLYPQPVEEMTSFERVISKRLDLAAVAGTATELKPPTPAELNEITIAVSRTRFKNALQATKVLARDGVPLNAYALGEPDRPAVFIVSACGMPVELCENWLRALAKKHYVITCESRGLFEGPATDCGLEDFTLDAQVGDVLAVMDHFNIRAAHVLGFCGGAVIALALAAMQPERVRSLSLWHGDYYFGEKGPRTQHQWDMSGLLEMAQKSRANANYIHRFFCSPSAFEEIDGRLAHLAVYPYATGERLHTYSRLNGNIMHADVPDLLPKVPHPALVITSKDDGTAHPEGSRLVSEHLQNARLLVEEHGDHIDLFNAGKRLTDLAEEFIGSIENTPLPS